MNINPFESNPGWDIIKAFYYYYGLKDYIDLWFNEKFRPDKILDIEAYDSNNKPGDYFFWQNVMTGNILPGQKIRLKNFQISPWFPRKPGLYWTYDASVARDNAMRNHIERKDKGGLVLDVYGKTLMTELGGIGSVNFRKDRDFVLITATASGKTEKGIPIVCRKNIWNKIEPEFQKERMIEVDLQGELVTINQENDSFFLRSPSIPKVAILINSLLNIKIKASRLEIVVSPWTIFKTKDKMQPYGFTYINHTLYVEDIMDSIDWIEKYVYEHSGKTILTDFDEYQHQLNAIFPLNDILNGSILTEDIIGYSQKIIRDFKNN